jgi:hypothetical protein
VQLAKGGHFVSKSSAAIKNHAYGVLPHTFTDYFQISEGLAAKCCNEFAAIMKQIYDEEFPTPPT